MRKTIIFKFQMMTSLNLIKMLTSRRKKEIRKVLMLEDSLIRVTVALEAMMSLKILLSLHLMIRAMKRPSYSFQTLPVEPLLK